MAKSTPLCPLPNLDQSSWLQTMNSFVNLSEQKKYTDDVLKVELGSFLYIRGPGFYEAFKCP